MLFEFLLDAGNFRQSRFRNHTRRRTRSAVAAREINDFIHALPSAEFSRGDYQSSAGKRNAGEFRAGVSAHRQRFDRKRKYRGSRLLPDRKRKKLGKFGI